MVRDFENAKTMDIYACRTTTTERIAKRMARGDSGHRVGLGRGTQRWLSWWDMSQRGQQQWCGILKMRKPWIFMLAAPQPLNVSQNGWHEEIQHIE